MDKVTPEALITFLWVAAALVGFTLAVWGLLEKIHKAKQPQEELKKWQAETEQKLKKDKERLDALEDGQRVMMRGMYALISHEINGNSDDKLKQSQAEIMNYLIDR